MPDMTGAKVLGPVMITMGCPTSELKVADANGNILPVARLELNAHAPGYVTLWLHETHGGDFLAIRERVHQVEYRVAP